MINKEFYQIIASGQSAYLYLKSLGIFPENTPACQKCSSDTALYEKKGRVLYRYRKRDCRSEFSIRRDAKFFTYFDVNNRCNSKLNLPSTFEIVFLWKAYEIAIRVSSC